MNPILTIVKRLRKIAIHVSLDQVLSEISSEAFKHKIDKIRKLNNEGYTYEAEKIKKALPAFIATGKYIGGHNKDNLAVFSGVISLDFDHVNSESYDQIFRKACSINTTLACFCSPSGNGMKILVPISAGPDNYENSYLQVAEFYKNELGIPFDSSCKDISRLCFFSYDPNLYKNLGCDVFQVEQSLESTIEEIELTEIPESNFTIEQSEILFKKAEIRTKKIIKYVDGNRNNFIYTLSYNCALARISFKFTQNCILSKYHYDKAEIVTTIQSAYAYVKRNNGNVNKLKDNLFSLDLLNLKKYRPDIELDKRIFFETLLIKAMTFGRVFFWTKEMMSSELGIKKFRANALINEFRELGFISVQVKTSNENGQPCQKTYFTVHPEKIMETSRILHKDNSEFVRNMTPFLFGDTFNSRQ